MRKASCVALATFAFTLGFVCSASAQQSPSTPPARTPATTAHKAQAPSAKKTPVPASRAQKPLALTTQKDRASYAIGLNIGKSMKRDSADIDPNILARGIKDALAGAKPLLTDEEVKGALTQLQVDLRAKQEFKMKLAGVKNEKEGAAFLAVNKTKEGVVTLPSGLQYKILKAGTGPKPTANDTVVCSYRGTLLDGTEFDSSAQHGGTVSFPVGQVIKGWTEALQLMPVGSKWEVYIPSELAYGSNGAGSDIGPNSTLVFDIELVEIKAKSEVAKPAAEAPESPAQEKPQSPN